MSLETAFYDEPAWYDLIHEPDSAEEFKLVYDLFRLHGNGGKDVLEPACGTGRLLARFLNKGFRCTGYDINVKSILHCRKRHRGITVLRGDMRTFVRPARFDFAFNLLGTFRHLMSDKDALAHLRCMAKSLRPGGVYVVELDLADYEHAFDEEETWTARKAGRSVNHVMLGLAPDRERRREKILHYLTLREKGKSRLLESAYDLRSYDLEQWRALIGASPFYIASSSLFPEQGPGVRNGVFALKLR